MTHRRHRPTETEQRDHQLATTAMTIAVQRAVKKLLPTVQDAIQSELCKLLLKGNERVYTITLITTGGRRQMPTDYHDTHPSWAVTIVTKALTVSEDPNLLAIQIMIGPEEHIQLPLNPRTTRVRSSEGTIDAIRTFWRNILGPNSWFS